MNFIVVNTYDNYCGERTCIIDANKITSITWNAFGDVLCADVHVRDQVFPVMKESANAILDMFGFNKAWFWNTAEKELRCERIG